MKNVKQGSTSSATVTIASGGDTSGEFDTQGASVLGLIFPTMTGTAMMILASPVSGGTFVPIYDNAGSALSLTIASGHAVGLTADKMAILSAFRYIKLKSGSTEAADRTVTIVTKG